MLQEYGLSFANQIQSLIAPSEVHDENPFQKWQEYLLVSKGRGPAIMYGSQGTRATVHYQTASLEMQTYTEMLASLPLSPDNKLFCCPPASLTISSLSALKAHSDFTSLEIVDPQGSSLGLLLSSLCNLPLVTSSTSRYPSSRYHHLEIRLPQ